MLKYFIFLFLLCACSEQLPQNNFSSSLPKDAEADVVPVVMNSPAVEHLNVCIGPRSFNMSTPPPIECDPWGEYRREDPEFLSYPDYQDYQDQDSSEFQSYDNSKQTVK